MSKAVLELDLPRDFFQFGLSREQIQHRLIEGFVISLFTEGRVSSGKAAKLLGMSRVEFLSLLRERGVAYINYTPEELAEELAAAKELDAGISH